MHEYSTNVKQDNETHHGGFPYSKDALSLLRRRMPRNYAKRIAEKTNYSTHFIYEVMTCRRKNLTIIETAIQIAEDEEKRIENIKQTLTK